MKYLNIRNVKVPKIGFGTWCIGDNPEDLEKELAAFNHGYLKHQMTLIDTAEMYGSGKSEKVIGEFLKGKNRKDFFIVNKILPSNASKGLYEERCRHSLEIMGLDYFDLYLLHWRSNVNLQYLVENMEYLVEIGLIKNWGVSNFDVEDMEELFSIKNGDHCFANQCLFNLLSRGAEYDLIPWCQKHDVLFMAYSPLGNNKEDREKVTKNIKIIELAKKYHRTPESLMLAFSIHNSHSTALFKTSSIEHLDSNLKNVFMDISLEEMEEINQIFPKTNKKVRLEKI